MSEAFDELAQYRAELDDIDSRIIDVIAPLLEERDAVIDEVTQYKIDHGTAVYQPEREADMIARREVKARDAGLNPGMVRPLWEVILRFSRARQEAIIEDSSKRSATQ